MFTVGWETAPLYESEVCMKAVVKVDIVDGKCVVIYSDGSEQELYDVSDDTGGGGTQPVLGEKNIINNGIYNAEDDGYDGYSQVSVAVTSPPPVLAVKEITSNGTYNASNDNVDGYARVIVNVPASGGDGITLKQLAENTQPSGSITLPNDVTILADYAFAGKPITNIIAPGVTDIKPYSLHKTSITSLDDTNFPSLPNDYAIYLRMPNLITFETNKPFKLSNGNGAFKDCTALQSVRIPNAADNVMGSGCFQSDSNLELVDLGNSNIGPNCFYQCNKLRTIILRKTTVATLSSNALTQTAYFKNGGAGGYVYVPSELIESYKVADVWSTFYGYGTITFRAIEGSDYEL